MTVLRPMFLNKKLSSIIHCLRQKYGVICLFALIFSMMVTTNASAQGWQAQSYDGGFDESYNSNFDDSFEGTINTDYDTPSNQFTQTGQNQYGQPMDVPNTTTNLPKDPPPIEKPSIWDNFKFWKTQKDEAGPVGLDEIVDVGPREPANKKEPLLRIPVPLRLEQGVLQPGFYLARYMDSGNYQNALFLYQKNRLAMRINMFAAESEHKSPIERVASSELKDVPLERYELKLSPDGHSLVVSYWRGNKKFQSPPLPTAIEIRPTYP